MFIICGVPATQPKSENDHQLFVRCTLKAKPKTLTVVFALTDSERWCFHVWMWLRTGGPCEADWADGTGFLCFKTVFHN